MTQCVAGITLWGLLQGVNDSVCRLHTQCVLSTSQLLGITTVRLFLFCVHALLPLPKHISTERQRFSPLLSGKKKEKKKKIGGYCSRLFACLFAWRDRQGGEQGSFWQRLRK